MTDREKRPKSQVTTRRGDKGYTTALSGDRYPKSHPLLECVGAVDELRAQTALARFQILEERPPDHEALAQFLFWLLHVYFILGSECSDPLRRKPQYHRDYVSKKHLDRLEAEQRRLEETVKLPPVFMVSAATPLAARIDVACTVARRLERDVVRLAEAVPEWRPDDLLKFVNRLSDYLYILARYVEGEERLPLDYAVLDGTLRKEDPAHDM